MRAGQHWVNVHSRERGLLALFPFSDVSERDAPTEIIIGSHLDVPRVLAPLGERGVWFAPLADALPTSTFERRRTFATGQAGDVFLCHPFIVHRATWPHLGRRPRMVAQPGIAIHEPFRLRRVPDQCLVERAIIDSLEYWCSLMTVALEWHGGEHIDLLKRKRRHMGALRIAKWSPSFAAGVGRGGPDRHIATRSLLMLERAGSRRWAGWQLGLIPLTVTKDSRPDFMPLAALDQLKSSSEKQLP
jgi:hypothetical protein